jgi:hypothetical protein
MAQCYRAKTIDLKFPDTARVSPALRATVAAVAQATNGRPADVEEVRAILGIPTRNAMTQRLVKAHQAGLIAKSGRFGWCPVGWSGKENRTPARWKRKPR